MLVLTEEARKNIESGKWKFMKGKTKELFKAVIVDAKTGNKIKKVADLKYEDVCNGIDPVNMAQQMQMIAVQEKLNEITDELEGISDIVRDVRKGQHNDRLALLDVGVQLFNEGMNDPDIKDSREKLNQSNEKLTEAFTKLRRELVDNINDLKKDYDSKKGMYKRLKVNDINDKIFFINSSFDAIHRCIVLKAVIACKQNKYDLARSILMDYKNKTLDKLLNEEDSYLFYISDKNENAMKLWTIRSTKLAVGVQDTVNRIDKKQELLLEFNKEDTTCKSKIIPFVARNVKSR